MNFTTNKTDHFTSSAPLSIHIYEWGRKQGGREATVPPLFHVGGLSPLTNLVTIYQIYSNLVCSLHVKGGRSKYVPRNRVIRKV